MELLLHTKVDMELLLHMKVLKALNVMRRAIMWKTKL